MRCWIWFASILLRIFASMFIRDIGLQCSFFSVSLPGFGIRVMLALQKVLGRSPSSSIFWHSFNRIGTSSSLYVWQNLAVNPSGCGFFWLVGFFITDSILELYIGLFRVSISSQFNLGRLCVSRICPFPLEFLVCVHRGVHNSL